MGLYCVVVVVVVVVVAGWFGDFYFCDVVFVLLFFFCCFFVCLFFFVCFLSFVVFLFSMYCTCWGVIGCVIVVGVGCGVVDVGCIGSYGCVGNVIGFVGCIVSGVLRSTPCILCI